MTVMPMFPLGTVLLPGAVLPLHVFEPRYAELVRHCVDAEAHEFGVVLIDRGHEVGGGDVRRLVGTVARIVQVAEVENGRYAMVAVGVRRVQVAEWLDDDPYPRADVVEWADEPSTADDQLASLLARVATHVRRTRALAVELGDLSAAAEPELTDDPLMGSYQLAVLAPVGPADEYDLLCAPGPRPRLELLDRMLDDIDAVHRFRLTAGSAGDDR